MDAKGTGCSTSYDQVGGLRGAVGRGWLEAGALELHRPARHGCGPEMRPAGGVGGVEAHVR